MNRFFVGFATCWLLDKLAWKVVLSGGSMGEKGLATFVGRLDHDRLLRIEDAVANEVMGLATWVARLDHDRLLRIEDAVANEVIRRRTLVP